MKHNFCGTDNLNKCPVKCVEFDGETSCFVLGEVPPAPDNPRNLNIIFPCCLKERLAAKTTSYNTSKQKQTEHASTSNKMQNQNMKIVNAMQCSSLSKLLNNANQNCILYVFDKSGFKQNIAFTKANIECSDSSRVDNLLESRHSTHNTENKWGNFPGKTIKYPNQNQGKSLRPCKSRELRGGILSTDCFCLRRNGLQYDCRRTGCQNSPLCSALPGPLCDPARVACQTHCANPHAEELSSICKLRGGNRNWWNN